MRDLGIGALERASRRRLCRQASDAKDSRHLFNESAGVVVAQITRHAELHCTSFRADPAIPNRASKCRSRVLGEMGVID